MSLKAGESETDRDLPSADLSPPNSHKPGYGPHRSQEPGPPMSGRNSSIQAIMRGDVECQHHQSPMPPTKDCSETSPHAHRRENGNICLTHFCTKALHLHPNPLALQSPHLCNKHYNKIKFFFNPDCPFLLQQIELIINNPFLLYNDKLIFKSAQLFPRQLSMC